MLIFKINFQYYTKLPFTKFKTWIEVSCLGYEGYYYFQSYTVEKFGKSPGHTIATMPLKLSLQQQFEHQMFMTVLSFPIKVRVTQVESGPQTLFAKQSIRTLQTS